MAAAVDVVTPNVAILARNGSATPSPASISAPEPGELQKTTWPTPRSAASANGGRDPMAVATCSLGSGWLALERTRRATNGRTRCVPRNSALCAAWMRPAGQARRRMGPMAIAPGGTPARGNLHGGLFCRGVHLCTCYT
eukprot:scaffold210452_cov32-Tisochrysis_lutea.AAC.1